MQLKIDQEQKEIKSHGSYAFPVLISYERLSYFDTGEFPWHWHPEIELTLVMEGKISYQVNDSLYELKEGEGLYSIPDTGQGPLTAVIFPSPFIRGFCTDIVPASCRKNI